MHDELFEMTKPFLGFSTIVVDAIGTARGGEVGFRWREGHFTIFTAFYVALFDACFAGMATVTFELFRSAWRTR